MNIKGMRSELAGKETGNRKEVEWGGGWVETKGLRGPDKEVSTGYHMKEGCLPQSNLLCLDFSFKIIDFFLKSRFKVIKKKSAE